MKKHYLLLIAVLILGGVNQIVSQQRIQLMDDTRIHKKLIDSDNVINDGTMVATSDIDGNMIWGDVNTLPVGNNMCLNDSTSFMPTNADNPLDSEVQNWAVINNVSSNTILTYYSVGRESSSCINPDITWWFKGGIAYEIARKTYTDGVLYVDSLGSDISGRRGYANYPFKSLLTALSDAKQGDVVIANSITVNNTVTLIGDLDITISGHWVFTQGNFDLSSYTGLVTFENCTIVTTETNSVIGTGDILVKNCYSNKTLDANLNQLIDTFKISTHVE